jgi:hypothetical protein
MVELYIIKEYRYGHRSRERYGDEQSEMRQIGIMRLLKLPRQMVERTSFIVYLISPRKKISEGAIPITTLL